MQNKDIVRFINAYLGHIKGLETEHYINFMVICDIVRKANRIKNSDSKFNFLHILNLIDTLEKNSDINKESKQDLKVIREIVLNYLKH